MARWGFVVGLLSLSVSLWAFDAPSYQSVTVNDFAEILSPSQEAEMTDALADLRTNTGVEMVVVTIREMAEYGYTAYEYEPFVTRWFNQWGVGRLAENDGVMIMLATEDRWARIELGTGYEAAMNKAAQRIFDRDMRPHLANNDFDTGLIEGVKATIRLLRERHGLAAERKWWQKVRFDPSVLIFAAFGGLFASITLGRTRFGKQFLDGLRFAWAVRRGRKCPNGHGRMQLVSEFDKAAHLSAAEAQEEALGSRKWYIYQCASCDEIERRGVKALASDRADCPQCGALALGSEDNEIEASTSMKEGSANRLLDCPNCGYHRSFVVSLPLISTSAGGGFGGGFGGGSSGGGGGGGRF